MEALAFWCSLFESFQQLRSFSWLSFLVTFYLSIVSISNRRILLLRKFIEQILITLSKHFRNFDLFLAYHLWLLSI